MLKELLTFIKKLVFEDLYHTASEKDFIKEYIDDTDICNFVIYVAAMALFHSFYG